MNTFLQLASREMQDAFSIKNIYDDEDNVKNSLLPPQSEKHKGKKTLVLDLDETLVHCSYEPIRGCDTELQIEFNNRPRVIYVFKRPGVEAFLEAAAENFEVVVFTASVQHYADPVIDDLDGRHVVSHRLYRDSCTPVLGGFVKDLSLLGRDLRHVILVDNSPHSSLFQPANAIHIAGFVNDPCDRELIALMDVLPALARINDVTCVLGLETDPSFQ